MSASDDLQGLIFAKLTNSADLGIMCGDRVYDNVPSKPEYPYISFGPSDYRPDDVECISGRVETFQLDCWSRDNGKKREARRLTDAVKSALHNVDGDLGDNALVNMRVVLVRVLDDPDGITAHGVVQVEARIEEG